MKGKQYKRYTLQAQITVIVGLILAVSCLLLTANSLFSAQSYYGIYEKLLEEGVVEYDPALPEGELPPAIDRDASYLEASQKFSKQSLLVMVFIIILALLVTYWATGRVLRPLKRLTVSVCTVDNRNLDQRVELPEAQGEVLELTESYNRMLERLENAFLIQKSFASNAAHELKTPLAVIKSALQVLELDPNPAEEDYHEFMADTGKSLERIIKTVDGLLSLANLEGAAVDSVVTLYPLAEQAVRELTVEAEARGVMVSVTGEREAKACGNQSLLYRVIFNLIENAVKYNHIGGRVEISIAQEKEEVSVIIKDNGMGIDEEVLPHIFEPFYRGDQSRSQQIPGSGLGLAVVKLIMERHGGNIKAESRSGEGAVFTITLKGTQISPLHSTID